MSLLKAVSNDDNNGIWLLIGIVSLVFYPVAIISIILTLIFKAKKVRYPFLGVVLFLLLFVTNCISSNAIATVFMQEYSNMIFQIVNSNNIILKVLAQPFKLSYVSWFVIITISSSLALTIADYINQCVNEIKPLEDEFKQIQLTNKKEAKKMILSQNIAGKTIIGNSGKRIVTTDDKAKHIFVCGTTGSGKTVLLSNYIESGINQNYKMLLVDGKGDTGKGSMLDNVKQLAKDRKVYIIDLNNPEKSSKYNPFRNANATICKDMIVNMTEWTEPHYKANAERYIQRVAKLLTIAEIPLSFKTIIKYIPKDDLELLNANLSKNGKITKQEHLETLNIIKTSGEITENAMARFSLIAESEIGCIFENDGIDIYTALDENAIILFVLNPLIYPELSPLIGRLILIDAKKAVSKMFEKNDTRTFFIFDEINVYASPVLIDLINKSRSANVTCIPATQSLADLEFASGEAFKQQLIENCNNYIVMRQNSAKSAEEWAKILGTREAIEITHQLGNEKHITNPTGYGSARKTRQFVYHPDDIKDLDTGEAIYLSKDVRENYRIHVRKGI